MGRRTNTVHQRSTLARNSVASVLNPLFSEVLYGLANLVRKLKPPIRRLSIESCLHFGFTPNENDEFY